jgi:hypothetical protein
MGAKVKNPRKKFLWSITFPKHPINTYLFQTCTLPDVEIDQVAHGDVNRDVKTAGRVTVGNLVVGKLLFVNVLNRYGLGCLVNIDTHSDFLHRNDILEFQDCFVFTLTNIGFIVNR